MLRVIKFKQSIWIDRYLNLDTEKRKVAVKKISKILLQAYGQYIW